MNACQRGRRLVTNLLWCHQTPQSFPLYSYCALLRQCFLSGPSLIIALPWRSVTPSLMLLRLDWCDPGEDAWVAAEYFMERRPTALTAVASCWQPDSCQQLWQLIQAVDSFQSLCKLLTALAAYTGCQQLKLAVASCWQLWQLIQAVSSLTAVISCRQLWQLIQTVVSFDSL